MKAVEIWLVVLTAVFAALIVDVSANCEVCKEDSSDILYNLVSTDMINLGSGGDVLPTHLGCTVPIRVTWYGTPVRGASVSVDFKRVGTTDSKGYCYATMNPGRHTVQASSRRIAPPAGNDPCPNRGCLSGATQYTAGNTCGVCTVPVTLNCNC